MCIQPVAAAAHATPQKKEEFVEPTRTIFHDNNPRSGVGKKYKWATSLDTQFVFDFAAARPHQRITSIAWDASVRGIQRSESGSEVLYDWRKCLPSLVTLIRRECSSLIRPRGLLWSRAHALSPPRCLPPFWHSSSASSLRAFALCPQEASSAHQIAHFVLPIHVLIIQGRACVLPSSSRRRRYRNMPHSAGKSGSCRMAEISPP